MPDVSHQEIADAFYRSYGEGTPAGLDAQLVDAGTGDRRRLTAAAGDAQFVACWMETRRLLRAARGYVPIPLGFSISGPVISCQQAALNTDRPKYEPAAWNDYDATLAKIAVIYAQADQAAALTAHAAALAAPADPLLQAAATAAAVKAGKSAVATLSAGGGAVQQSTNCYAYAMNSRLGHPKGVKPQPGEKSGKQALSSACPAVSAAVVKDGAPDTIEQAARCPYNLQQQKPPPDRAGYYLVALVSTSKPNGYDAADNVFYGNDYHWYRQDQDGSWSHKPGHDKVRNTDSEGKPIANPETAGRRTVYPGLGGVYAGAAKDLVIDYDIFCGYFHVKKDGAPVGK